MPFSTDLQSQLMVDAQFVDPVDEFLRFSLIGIDNDLRSSNITRFFKYLPGCDGTITSPMGIGHSTTTVFYLSITGLNKGVQVHLTIL